jgi:hypothetical protein
MKSSRRGSRTSDVEVTNVSPNGFWILIDERELFVSFEDFPFFKDSPIGQISKVVRPSPDHLYWPALDIDLSVESIERPEDFPLVSRGGSARARRSR